MQNKESLSNPTNLLLSCNKQNEFLKACNSNYNLKGFKNTFEGPEKNLEIDFKPKNPITTTNNNNINKGARQLTRIQLDTILSLAKCQILSKISNDYMDAYILSESSLFIYPFKIIIKTCGTTTLLKILPLLIKYMTIELPYTIDWIGYSRKNFLYPQDQMYPHNSFHSEINYLHDTISLINHNKLNGNAYILGSITNDHWLTYIWDDGISYDNSYHIHTNKITNTNETSLHLLMHDLSPDKAKPFLMINYPNELKSNIKYCMTENSGIKDLVPDAKLDQYAFDKCGYSMNGIKNDTYFTIHITPESHCSYASFETNLILDCYQKLIIKVLKIFLPSKFTMTMHSEKNIILDKQKDFLTYPFIQLNEFITTNSDFKNTISYSRVNLTETQMGNNYSCVMGNWILNKEKIHKKDINYDNVKNTNNLYLLNERISQYKIFSDEDPISV